MQAREGMSGLCTHTLKGKGRRAFFPNYDDIWNNVPIEIVSGYRQEDIFICISIRSNVMDKNERKHHPSYMRCNMENVKYIYIYIEREKKHVSLAADGRFYVS